MAYQELADLVGQDYVPMAHQIAALSDGRDRRSGLGLLERQSGRHARARLVACSDAGKSFVQRFVAEPDDSTSSKNAMADIISRTLLALDAVLARNPKISLGTLCVYLHIATHQDDFAYEGRPVRDIAEHLGLSNLPNHLRVLEGASDAASQLVGFHVNEYDQRIRLPYLTNAGVALQCALVSALTRREVQTPRVPHPEALDALETPADMHQLTEADFDDIVWD